MRGNQPAVRAGDPAGAEAAPASLTLCAPGPPPRPCLASKGITGATGTEADRAFPGQQRPGPQRRHWSPACLAVCGEACSPGNLLPLL